MLSSVKQSDYDFYVYDKSDETDKCYLLNKPLGVSSIQIDEVKRNMAEIKRFQSVKLPLEIKLGYSDKMSRQEIQEIRKKFIEVHKKRRSKMQDKNYSKYERKMKKIVKRITTILYHHILHSHTYLPSPSEGALLFSEANFIEYPFQLLATSNLGTSTTFPTFVFSVLNKEPEPEEEHAHDMDRNEISEMINYIFEELHLAHE